MDERLKDFCAALSETGCGSRAIEGAAWLMEAGQRDELIRHLRRCRCELVDAMHESQRRVDRLDRLIRQAEKTSV